MPQYEQHASWRLEGGGQIIDPETAVKGGILGGGGGGGGLPTGKDGSLVVAAEKIDLRKMIEELDSEAEDVPSVFICPISLEPMVDPVTLITGQTYERANILKWFSMGHLTCPTTMQELWDDAVTPNRTLYQLISAWFSQRYLQMKKRSEDVQGRAAELIQTLKKAKGQVRVQALKELHNIVISHAPVNKSVVDIAGVTHLSSLLGPFTSHAVGSEVIAILVNLTLDSDTKSNLMQPAKISLVVDLLNEGTIDTKINCTKLIEMLMAERCFRSEVVSSLSLLVALLRLVKDKRHPNGVAAGLTLLKDIGSHAQVRSLMVSVGAVPQLVELLSNPKWELKFIEPALQILDDLSTTPEGLSALKDCPQAIRTAVRLLMNGSDVCTHHALSILWAVCKLAFDECASLAVEAGLGAKLLLLRSGCNPEMKQRAAELLKLCSRNYSPTVFSSKCKLTRTIQ
ncbi:U-box domain-containing protein 30-like [Zingiber officinale]|uniref:U-box domain-containing protein 30-like n=1 Tax=Zingiber officinale TaxID=94328 RepID=UPI001C4BF13C|nr:U-box domain-containing protein 30-like [Zingiber officinale]